MRTTPVVVIVGPTATGKSAVAVPLAQELCAEIVSADSRMVYRGMDIGTGKPPLEVRRGVPHHLIDVVDPDEPFTVGRYCSLAHQVTGGLAARGVIPLVVGGTGLYIKALLYGLWVSPEPDLALRRRLEAQARRVGPGALHEVLARVDPETAQHVHPHDGVRIIRALEVYYQTGCPLSAFHRQHNFQGPQLARVVLIGLRRTRDDLARRIRSRIEAQLTAGFVEEVTGLLARGYHEWLPAMSALGYRQIIRVLKGECSLAEAVLIISRDTRLYAKRQLTWFRQEPRIRWIDLDAQEETEAALGKIRTCLAAVL